MTLKKWCSVLGILKKLGVVGVQITGGEPFVRKDIWEILDKFPNKFLTGVLTN